MGEIGGGQKKALCRCSAAISVLAAHRCVGGTLERNDIESSEVRSNYLGVQSLSLLTLDWIMTLHCLVGCLGELCWELVFCGKKIWPMASYCSD